MKQAFFSLCLVCSVLFVSLSFRPAAELPAGSYVTTLKAEELPAGWPAELKRMFAGQWTLKINANGNFSTLLNGNVMAEGSYTIENDVVTFQDKSGSAACLDGEGNTEEGKYGFELKKKTLTLRETQERCVGRQVVLTTHPLEKQ